MAYVALDYGHGSNTGTSVRNGDSTYREHDFNADVGERTRRIIEAHGIHTLVTQPPHMADVGLDERVNRANREKVDLFVSFHANYGTANASGACVFAWEGSKGNQAADAVVRHFQEQGIELHGDGRHISRRGSWTNFQVIRETSMPSILIEHGFMSNDRDFENIFGSHKESYRQKCAEADAKGILDYFGIKYNEVSKAPVSSDKDRYRLATGAFENAAALADAHARLKEAYSWMTYERADDTNFDPTLRLFTGTFVGRNVAEYYAEELREKFGWTIYVKKA